MRLVSCVAQTLARSQQLWVLYSTCTKGDLFDSTGNPGQLYSERDYLARPWCVYELAMYVKTKKIQEQPAEIEIISLDGNNSLGAQLSTFFKLIVVGTFLYFFHLFSLGVVTNDNVGCGQDLEMFIRCPSDDTGAEGMNLSDWKAAKRRNVHADFDPFVWMGQGNHPGTLMHTAGGFWPYTFGFVFVAYVMKSSLKKERLAICKRLETFSWADVKEGTNATHRNEVERRIEEPDSFGSIPNFEEEMQKDVQNEFNKSLLKRERRTMTMLAVFWFFGQATITQTSLFAVDAWRPVLFPEDIATLGEENPDLWLAILILSYPCICCISCCAAARMFTSGGLRKLASVAPA